MCNSSRRWFIFIWSGFSRPLFAFYDLNSSSREVPLEDILKSDILFRVYVMDYATRSGRWSIIGHAPLGPEFREPAVFYKQDPLNGELSLYHQDGREEPATREMCEGLECAAVWDPEHIEDRLFDHFRGISNKWVESLKLTS